MSYYKSEDLQDSNESWLCGTVISQLQELSPLFGKRKCNTATETNAEIPISAEICKVEDENIVNTEASILAENCSTVNENKTTNEKPISIDNFTIKDNNIETSISEENCNIDAKRRKVTISNVSNIILTQDCAEISDTNSKRDLKIENDFEGDVNRTGFAEAEINSTSMKPETKFNDTNTLDDITERRVNPVEEIKIKPKNDSCNTDVKPAKSASPLFKWPEICSKSFAKRKMMSCEEFLRLKDNPEDMYEENTPAMKYLNIIQDSYTNKAENENIDLNASKVGENSGVKVFRNKKYNEIYESLMVWQEDFETVDGRGEKKSNKNFFGLDFGKFF